MGGGQAAAESSGYPKLNFNPKGHQIRDIYQDRIKQFTAEGQYASQNLRSMWDHDSESSKDYVKLESYSVPELARPLFKEAIKGSNSLRPLLVQTRLAMIVVSFGVTFSYFQAYLQRPEFWPILVNPLVQDPH